MKRRAQGERVCVRQVVRKKEGKIKEERGSERGRKGGKSMDG